MKKKIGLWILTGSLLAGCGGGGSGGGSGDSAPSNLSPGSGTANPTPEVNAGIFSDAPVSGLKYRQGGLEGITDAEGRFQYDSNSDVPLEFLIGHTSLGYADGAELITPFDLNDSVASANFGLNVSRLLITLDVDANPDNGIELSGSTQLLVAELPFDLPPDAFESDQQVKKFAAQAGISTLVSLEDTYQHISRNPRIQEQIEVGSQITDQINRLDIGFDADLVAAGLLARVTADNGEQLYLFSDPQTGWVVSSALYVSGSNSYTFVSFDSDGFIRYVNLDGVGWKTLTSTTENTLPKYLQMLDLGNYKGSADNVLLDISGAGGISPKFGWDYSAISAINAAMSGFSEGQLSSVDIARVGAIILGAVHQIRCQSNAVCHNQALLRTSLDRWLVDPDFADRVTTVQQGSFDLSGVCLSFASVDDGSICGSEVSMASILSWLGGRLGADLVIWDSRMKKLAPMVSWGDDGGFMRVTISSYEDVQKVRDLPDRWNTKIGPVPEPWIVATADLGVQLGYHRLSEDLLYYELSTTGVFIRPLWVSRCRYDFRVTSTGEEVYIGSCDPLDDGAPEVQAVLELMRDLHPIAFSRRGILYKEVYGLDVPVVHYRSMSDAEAAKFVHFYGGLDSIKHVVDNHVANLQSERYISGFSSFSHSEEAIQNGDSSWHFSFGVGGDMVDPRFPEGKIYFDVMTFAPNFDL